MSNTLQPEIDNLFPFLQLEPTNQKAEKIKKLLLDLSRDETDQELKSAFRQTAEFFRVSFFGLTEKQIRLKITETLRDYYDGEKYTSLEIDNLEELTGIKEKKLLPILEKMVAEKIIVQGRRRRWQEMGEHYNPIYKLNK